MHDSAPENRTNRVDVTLSAIDGGYLVLESANDKTRFRWPLEKIPRPLEIGSRLTLELQKSGETPPDGIQHTQATPAAAPAENRYGAADCYDDKESRMRKLLEELVN